MEKLIITVIGTGNVGRVLCKELLDLEIPMHINIEDPAPITDAIKEDLRHATSFSKQTTISWNEPWLNKSDYIFISAALQATTIGNRLDNAKAHIQMMYQLFENFIAKDNVKIIVISNPVDVNTYHVIKATGLSAEQVIGTGTYLETLRFQYYLSQLFHCDLKDVEGYLLGEHGNSAVTIHSRTRIKGEKVAEEIVNEAATLAIQAPYKIRTAGEFTKYAISKCGVGVFKALHFKQTSTLPLALLLNEKNCSTLRCEPVCLSTIVQFENGKMEQGDLSLLEPTEIENLKKSAEILSQFNTLQL